MKNYIRQERVKSWQPHLNFCRLIITIDDLKFRTPVARPKCLDKQCRPRSECFWIRASLFAILTRILWITVSMTNIFLRTEREMCSKFKNIYPTYLAYSLLAMNHFLNSQLFWHPPHVQTAQTQNHDRVWKHLNNTSTKTNGLAGHFSKA